MNSYEDGYKIETQSSAVLLSEEMLHYDLRKKEFVEFQTSAAMYLRSFLLLYVFGEGWSRDTRRDCLTVKHGTVGSPETSVKPNHSV